MRAVVRHAESAEQLLTLNRVVDGRFDGLLDGVGVCLLLRDPRNVTNWQVKDLLLLTLDVGKPDAVKGATLQVETLELNRTLAEFTVLERRNKLQLVDSDLLLASGSLSESVKEGFRVQEVTQVDWGTEQGTLLDAADEAAQGGALLIDRADPSTWVYGTIVHLLPRAGQLILQEVLSNRLCRRGQHD